MSSHTKVTLLIGSLLGLGIANNLNLFERIGEYFARKNAVQEWQDLIHSKDVNYQVALQKFERFNQRFTATADEKELFRNWKKTVRWHTTPDGLIYDPQQYTQDLTQFRTSNRPPTPNAAEAPISYLPPSIPNGTKISLSLPNANQLGYWVSAGYRGNPTIAGSATGNGGATGVAIDPNNPNIVYACIRNGGLWKSQDYGKSYEPITDYFESPYCQGVGIGSNNSQVLYLFQSGKIWYSDDAGHSWENRSNGFSGSADEIHVDPQNSNRALAASNAGLYLTTDAGQTWTKVLDGVFREIETTSNWSSLGTAKDESNPNASFFLSTDRGATWVEKTVSTNRNPITRLYLAFHQRTHDDSLIVYAYLIKTSNTPTRYAGLYRSNDRGNLFTEVKAPAYTYPNGPVPLSGDQQNGYTELTDDYGGVNPYHTSSWVGEFWVSPANPNHMITMREKLWYSINGGQTWNYGPSYGEAGWADRRFATSNPTKDSLWICDDGGLAAIAFSDLFPWQGDYKKFIYKNGTIAASEGTNLGISTYNKDVFLTGGQDVGQVFQRNGKSTHVHSVDIYRGQISPWNDSLYWTSSFTHKLTDQSTVQLTNQVTPDHFDPLRVYGFTGDGVLYRTRSGQNAWSFSDAKNESAASGSGVNQSNAFAELVDLSSTGVTSWNSWTFEQSRALAEMAFIGDENGRRLFKTDNLSANNPQWTQVTSAPALTRYRIATHPHNAKLVAIAGEKAVWISRDGGTTWEELKGFPATGVISLLFDPNTSEGLYVSNSLTVWYRDESMTSWKEFNRGLPLQQIMEMKMAHYADGESRLWVAKYGRGVWSSPLYSSLQKKALHADFAIHSSTKKNIYQVGDSIQLYDLSSGEITDRTWQISGAATSTVVNQASPKFGFGQVGDYDVSLKIQGAGKKDSILKKAFIRIIPKVRPIDSIPPEQTGGVWYMGISSLDLNGQTHTSKSNESGFYEDLTSLSSFLANTGDSAQIQIVPSYNDATWGQSYAKVYIDYNNSGTFENSELIYNSSTTKQGHLFKFLAPNTVVQNVPLRLRVLVNRLNPITDAYQGQATQGQVEDHTVIYLSSAPTFKLNLNAPKFDSLSLSAEYNQTQQVIDQGFIINGFKNSPEINDPGRYSINSKSSPMSLGLSKLQKNQKYYARAYVIDTKGTWLSPVDSIMLPRYTQPLIQTLSPNFDPNTQRWSALARMHGEGSVIDSVQIEYGIRGNLDHKIKISTPTGPRNQWDTLSYEINSLPLYEQVQYRMTLYSQGEVLHSAIQQFNSKKDLYAYWTFDDQGNIAKDYSGNNHNLSLSPDLNRSNDDRGGQALHFDTTLDVATIGQNNIPQPFTALFRVKRSQNSPIGYAVIFDGENRRFDLEGWNNTHKLTFQAQNVYDRTTGYSSPVNEWHQIAFTVANDTANLYVDGIKHSIYYVPGYSLPMATLGKSGASMYGDLDEIKIFQRSLSSIEVQQESKVAQFLTFETIPTLTEGDNAFTLKASAFSGRPIRFEISQGQELINLSGDQLTPIKAGTAIIRAIVDGDQIFVADTQMQTVQINPYIAQDPKLVFNTIPTLTEGEASITLSASIISNQIIRFDVVSGQEFVSLSGDQLTPIKAGTAVIRAMADANNRYTADTSEQTITIKARAVKILTSNSSQFLQIMNNQNQILFSLIGFNTKQAQLRITQVDGSLIHNSEFRTNGKDHWATSCARDVLKTNKYFIIIDYIDGAGKSRQLRKDLIIQ